MKTQFYILGLLLRYGPQHGYLLKQTVEEQISDFAQIKLPTIYYNLEKLAERGYVSAAFQKDGNRPEKMVYSITEEGEKYFNILLKKMQAEELHMELPLDGALFFRERIDTKEFADSIKNSIRTFEDKLNRVIAHRDNVMQTIPDVGRANAQAIFSHSIYHLRAELDWLKEIEKGL